ncbi:hypothetical protein AB840_09105 [Megasphaera cerevisiae DSM 20462]|jgi:quercetin dioxygenase-like cupin family protein|uniref:Cupin type-2 domain-containing protein n=1 Tax=Megasphaera cerevisiae DSM 20462 TaxID=1122219 RepID=A0A0J6WRY1_9FIRM|nr:cupin domain-containing protein [Megasphaera cerevisiae]KMO86255.1 hypothetical protein AB840_09105 [Megasphaera cerevisiae DSM 20462]OKY53051.1 hypothetical protein BSR42_09600 [Megasphaera cerevisiae]SKA15811.1 Cupin domain protein [Megasphaera cerevisiae DSM 20462]
MYITNLDTIKSAEVPQTGKAGIPISVKWLLGEPEGAPNYELRYLTFPVHASTLYHKHAWEHEVFIVKGQGILKTRHDEILLKDHDAILILPGEEHQLLNRSETDTFDIICVVPKGTRSFSCQCG